METGDDRQIRGVTTLVTRTESCVDWSWCQNIITSPLATLSFMFRTLLHCCSLQDRGHSGILSHRMLVTTGCAPGSGHLWPGVWVSGPGCDVSVSCPALSPHSPHWPGPGPSLFILSRPVECHPSRRIERTQTSGTWTQVSEKNEAFLGNTCLLSAFLYFTNMPIFTFSWQTSVSIDERSF